MDAVAGGGGRPIDLVYFDPEWTDYHPGHVRIFAERAGADPRVRSMHFVLAPGYATDARELVKSIVAGSCSLEFCSEEVAMACSTDAPSSRARGAARWAETRRILEARPGATVFGTPFDDTLAAAALDRRPLPGQVSGVVFFCAPAVFGDAATRLKLGAKYLLARRREIPVVFTFDQVFLDRAPRMLTADWRRAPDPLPLTPAQFERLLHAPPAPAKSRVEFLLFGGLGPHKGLFEILSAVALLGEAAREVRVRFLGKYVEGGADTRARFLAEIERTRAQTGADIVFEERFASEDEIIDALIQCDVMLATRRHHEGVSNNFVWSAAAGRPAISQDSGWMGHMTVGEKLGLVCDPLNPAAIAAAMRQTLDPAWRAAFAVEGPRRWAAAHTADGYYETVVSALAQTRRDKRVADAA